MEGDEALALPSNIFTTLYCSSKLQSIFTILFNMLSMLLILHDRLCYDKREMNNAQFS
jgi:hypothetical protein